MNYKKNNLTTFISIIIIIIMFITIFLPIANASSTKLQAKSFTKGVSYKPVIPTKKTTFINYDEDSYLDDYANLASVPTAVFDDGEQLISHPLLFYQDRILYHLASLNILIDQSFFAISISSSTHSVIFIQST